VFAGDEEVTVSSEAPGDAALLLAVSVVVGDVDVATF